MRRTGFLFLIFLSLPASALANTLYFPQVAYGGGYTTTFVILNTGTAPISSQLNFYSQAGVQVTSATLNVPQRGSARFTLPNTEPAIKVGWGVFAAGASTVQGVATFELRGTDGGLVSSAGVIGIESGSSFLVPVDITTTASTGIAIANVSADSAVSVRLRLLAEDGTQVATANDISLVARQQFAKFVAELFPQLGGKNFVGTLSVDSGTPTPLTNALAATALTINEGKLSALPVIPIAQLPGNVPVLQSDLIRVVITMLAVAPDNSRATLGITIENTSVQPVYLGLKSNAGLSDDRATGWRLNSFSGIQTLSAFASKPSDFTAIAPSERITVLFSFSKFQGGNARGTTFSFAAEGTYYTPLGLRSVSIGIPSISIGQQPNNLTMFQSDSIRVAVGQIAVTPDNGRVSLSLTIQNTTTQTIYLGLDGSMDLSDDRATNWRLDSFSGIRNLSAFASGPSDFTAIAPSERITVIFAFSKLTGETTPGTTFTFAAQGTYYTPSGLKNVSVGISAIKPAAVAANVINQSLECLIFVHGSREADADKLNGTNWLSPAEKQEGRDYWRTYNLNYIFPQVGLTGDDFIWTATGNGKRAHYVVNYNGATPWWSEEAAGLVAKQIIEAIDGKPDGTANNDGCKKDGQLASRYWVIAHSAGATVMDYILGNSRQSDVYSNTVCEVLSYGEGALEKNGIPQQRGAFRGDCRQDAGFDKVAAGIEGVISVGGAHSGTQSADLVCGGYLITWILLEKCTDLRIWMMWDKQVRKYASAPAKPIFLIGGHREIPFASSIFQGGSNDGVLNYASQFACLLNIPYVNEDVCDRNNKQAWGFFNVDAVNENHDDERNTSVTPGVSRTRSAVNDGIRERVGGDGQSTAAAIDEMLTDGTIRPGYLSQVNSRVD